MISSGVSSTGDTGARQGPSATRTAGTAGARPRRRRRRAPPSPAPAHAWRRSARRSPLRRHRRPRARSRRSRCLVVVLVGIGGPLPQLDQHELPLGIETEADEPGPEQRHGRLLQRSGGIGDRRSAARDSRRRSGRGTPPLRWQQLHLLLLDEHRELRVLRARLDVEGTLARFAHGAGAERVDVVELDDLTHHDDRSRAPCSAGSSGFSAGFSSSRVPVSLHLTIAAPYCDSSNTVTEAGDTTMRWNRSRCTPV